MIFLRNTTSINLPQVYAVYRSGEHDAIVIVMEFLPRSNLLQSWPRLSATHGISEALEKAHAGWYLLDWRWRRTKS